MQATRILPWEVLHPLISLKPFLLFILNDLEHPVICDSLNRDLFETKKGFSKSSERHYAKLIEPHF